MVILIGVNVDSKWSLTDLDKLKCNLGGVISTYVKVTEFVVLDLDSFEISSINVSDAYNVLVGNDLDYKLTELGYCGVTIVSKVKENKLEVFAKLEIIDNNDYLAVFIDGWLACGSSPDFKIYSYTHLDENLDFWYSILDNSNNFNYFLQPIFEAYNKLPSHINYIGLSTGIFDNCSLIEKQQEYVYNIRDCCIVRKLVCDTIIIQNAVKTLFLNLTLKSFDCNIVIPPSVEKLVINDLDIKFGCKVKLSISYKNRDCILNGLNKFGDEYYDKYCSEIDKYIDIKFY